MSNKSDQVAFQQLDCHLPLQKSTVLFEYWLNSEFMLFLFSCRFFESFPFAHIAIDHSHSQQPVPRDFSLFKHCEWLVGKRAPLGQTGATCFYDIWSIRQSFSDRRDCLRNLTLFLSLFSL